MRYTYSIHNTRERAKEALEEYFATAEVSEAEKPEIEPYTDKSGKRRYRVTLNG